MITVTNKLSFMSLIKTPEEKFINELEGYLDIKFDPYSRNKVGGLLSGYKKDVQDLNPIVITNEKIVYRHLKIGENPPENVKIADPYEVLAKISEATGLTLKDITGKKRKAEQIVARHIGMYFIRALCGQTLSSTGRIFNRDHTTVIHAIDHVINMIEVQSPQYLKLIGYINFHLAIPEIKTA